MISNSLKKVVQVTASLDPKLGGPVQVVQGIAPFLQKEFNHEILVFGENKLENFEVLHENTIFGNRYGLIFNLFSSKFRSELSEADILLLHGVYLFSTLYALAFAKTKSIFIMPHGSLESYQASNSSLKKSIFHFCLRRLLKGRRLHFLVGSRQEVDSIRIRYAQERISVVSLGVLVDNNVETSRFNENDIINLFCMSRITQKKRIDICIEALKYLNRSNFRFRLSVYGRGDERLKKELLLKTSALELEHLVDFYDFIEGSEKAKAIQSSHILLLPSENENFAVAVAEAIVNLKPVIVSQYVAMHEFVDKNKVGITINNLNPIELAQRIIDVVNNYDFYSSNCFKFRQQLSWESVSRNWISVLNEGEL